MPSAANEACPDCGQVFPLREGEGRCQKCSKLAEHGRNSPDYTEISQHWEQCALCGISLRNLRLGPEGACPAAKCIAFTQLARATGRNEVGSTQQDAAGGQGASNELDLSMRRRSTYSINEVTQQRAADVAARLKRGVSAQSAPAPGTIHTTASLQHHEHAGGKPGEPKFHVGWQVRISNRAGQVENRFGSGIKPAAASVFMEDVKAEILAIINMEWIKHKPAVQPQETSLRWAGNKLLQPNTSGLCMSDFFDFYNVPSETTAAINGNGIPTAHKSHKRRPGANYLWLELYIDYEAYNNRMEGSNQKKNMTESATAMYATRSKRPRNESFLESHATRLAKTGRTGPSITSIFQSRTTALPRRHDQLHVPQGRSAVNLQKFTYKIGSDGSADLISTGTKIAGYISDVHFRHGTTKLAFEFFSGDATLVAKRFYRFDSSDKEGISDPIADLAEHRVQILNEAYRLAEGAFYLAEFYKYAEEFPEAAIAKNIMFTLCFVGEEDKTSNPSRASGFYLPTYQDEETGFAWLVEPKRSMTIMKFSGTLQHPTTLDDPQAQTIYAFAHYVYLQSKGELVFADIQGSLTNVDGKDMMVLFDIMTHTKDGTSGIGDFGPTGIESFLRDHKCGVMCNSLDLTGRKPRRDSNGDGDEDDYDQLVDD